MKKTVSRVNESINKDALYDILKDGSIGCDYTTTSDGEDFLIVDSWNDVQEIQKRLAPNFEPNDRYDSSIIDDVMGSDNWGFSDQYTTCSDCGEVIAFPQNPGDLCNYFVGDGYIVCEKCTKENYKDVYVDSLINNASSANTILSDKELSELGFINLNKEYKNGFYGEHDEPASILKHIKSIDPYAEVVFSLVHTGNPYEVTFNTWIKSDSEFEDSIQ